MASAAVKRMLKENYEKGCNGYLVELLNMWELDACYGFWVRDEVGGTYCYGDSIYLNMDEIIYCVVNDIKELEYQEYLDYNVMANEYNFNTLSLESWHLGAPRVPRETFDRLRKMKQDLMDAVQEEKERLKKQGNGKTKEKDRF